MIYGMEQESGGERRERKRRERDRNQGLWLDYCLQLSGPEKQHTGRRREALEGGMLLASL